MKFVIEAKKLKQAVDRLKAVLGPRPLIRVRLAADKDIITFTTIYSNDVCVHLVYDADILELEVVGIDLVNLYKIAKSFPKTGEITVSYESDTNMSFAGVDGKSIIPCFPGDNLPGWNFPIPEQEIGLEFLQGILKKTVYACAADYAKANIYGLHFWADYSSIKICGTDGVRLAQLTLEDSLFSLPNQKDVFITPPGGLVSLLNPVMWDQSASCWAGLAGKTTKIDREIERGWFVVHNGSITVALPAIIGQRYPNVEGISSGYDRCTIRFKVDRLALIQACQRIIPSKKDGRIKLKVVGEEGIIRLTWEDHLYTCSRIEQVGLYNLEGGDTEIEIEANYILEACHPIPDRFVRIRMEKDQLAPIFIEGDVSTNYRCLIMPIRM